MKKRIFAAALLLCGAAAMTPAVAMPLGPLSAPGATGDIIDAQYAYGGRDYCWYPDGWHGPGYYWCGYAFRRGFGWGGGPGWHGWGPGPGWRGPGWRGPGGPRGDFHGGGPRGGPGGPPHGGGGPRGGPGGGPDHDHRH